MIYVLAILCIIFATPFVLCVIDNYCGTSYSCKYWGWHNGKGDNAGNISFDGCSVHATCSKCGSKVMQDSQGNWF